ncbi:sporulation protein [Streptomyces albus subsp. chlorinus]|uniref:sporulation protein n=1 Tax=Streptomyces albus TaxID=1888 RepID=UPI0015700EB9|nr:sporulation protein [Streptomyces albus]NSC25546.1 sporulation protein [Streptomyces albus subsp. chlorinus]
MVFKRLLGAFGVGGPSVDTVLDDGPVRPGGPLSGQVHLEGGSSACEIDHISLELVARVEAEHGAEEHEGVVAFDRVTVGGGFRLAEGERRGISFTVTLPWETPLTELHGQPLGVVLGVRTELAVAGARDKGDLDRLRVAPLPAQEAVLEALGQLGFGFKSADLELGHIHGTGQSLPFYQEIELSPAPRYAHAVNEVEVTFLPSPEGIEVVVEADKRGGLFTDGHDTVSRFTVSHEGVEHVDWNAEVDSWLRQLAERHSAYAAEHADMYASPQGHFPHHAPSHDSQHHRSGPSTGAVVAGAAAGVAVGVAGGFVAAEVIDEVFDDDEGDDED